MAGAGTKKTKSKRRKLINTDSEYMDKVLPDIGKGRPKLIINEKGMQLIKVLSSKFCSDEEIADMMNTSVDTLHNKNNNDVFTECKEKGLSKGKTNLRNIQMKLAEKNAAMAIFLGKNYLGQSDFEKRDRANENAAEANTDDGFMDALKGIASEVNDIGGDEPEDCEEGEE